MVISLDSSCFCCDDSALSMHSSLGSHSASSPRVYINSFQRFVYMSDFGTAFCNAFCIAFSHILWSQCCNSDSKIILWMPIMFAYTNKITIAPNERVLCHYNYQVVLSRLILLSWKVLWLFPSPSFPSFSQLLLTLLLLSLSTFLTSSSSLTLFALSTFLFSECSFGLEAVAAKQQKTEFFFRG